MTVLVREDLNDHDLLWAAAWQVDPGVHGPLRRTGAWPWPEPSSLTKAATGSPAPGNRDVS